MLLSVNTMEVACPADRVEDCTKLRLFVSAVWPTQLHLGATLVPAGVPLSILVLTTIVDPVLKFACEPQQ